MKARGRPFGEARVRDMTFQILMGLAYMHKHGYFHRDMKPGEKQLKQGTWPGRLQRCASNTEYAH
jgi:serine/threonine protein kinase